MSNRTKAKEEDLKEEKEEEKGEKKSAEKTPVSYLPNFDCLFLSIFEIS